MTTLLSDLVASSMCFSPAGTVRAIGRIALALDAINRLVNEVPEEERADGEALAAFVRESLRAWGEEPRPDATDPRMALVLADTTNNSPAYQHLATFARHLADATAADKHYGYEEALLAVKAMEPAFDLLHITERELEDAFKAYRDGATMWRFFV